MNKVINIKNIILIICSFIIFFSFNIEVKAATAATCEYRSSKYDLFVQLLQSESGKFTYKYKTKKSDEWKKLDSSVIKISSKPKGELKKGCPNARAVKKTFGKVYNVSFNVAATQSNDIYMMGNITDSFNGYEDGRVDIQNGTNNGGTGKSNVKDSEGNLNCWYRLDDKYFFYMKQDKNGKKTFQYAYINLLFWQDYKTTDGEYANIVERDKNTVYKSCPTAQFDGKHIYVDDCRANTGKQCVSSLSYDPVERAANGSGKVSGKSLDELNSELVGEEKTTKSCKELLGDDIIEKIQEIVNIIRIMVPILLIVFGIIDFGKAIFVSDENEMKKSQSRFIRRLIVAIGFFLVPSILSILLNIAHNVWDVIPSAENAFCGITF